MTRRSHFGSIESDPGEDRLLGVPVNTAEQDLFEPNHFFFRPVQESLRDLEAHLEPRDKQVVSVMAYGGYPSFFLAEGAERVIGFDVDPRQVGWNLILREGLRNLDYESARRYFLHQGEYEELRDQHERIFETIPPEHLAGADAMAAIFEFSMNGEAIERVGGVYPHLESREVWEAAQNRVRAGAWEIHQAELLDLLECLERADEHVDILYISSIRNWYLHYRLADDPDGREKFSQYDQRLSKSVQRLLRPDGKMYEVIINEDGAFPRFPIDAETYPGFDISRHASCNENLETEIIVAQKA